MDLILRLCLCSSVVGIFWNLVGANEEQDRFPFGKLKICSNRYVDLQIALIKACF